VSIYLPERSGASSATGPERDDQTYGQQGQREDGKSGPQQHSPGEVPQDPPGQQRESPDRQHQAEDEDRSRIAPLPLSEKPADHTLRGYIFIAEIHSVSRARLAASSA